MIPSFRKALTHNLINIPGWRTNRRIVVIESDDWGSIRMPSREVYNEFLGQGLRVDNDPYCRYDSLETSEDLSSLFDTLRCVKDKNGRNAVLTANSVVANPNFDRIRESDFSDYFYEPVLDSYQKHSSYHEVHDLIKEGIKLGIYKPQFHGREHLYIKKWLHHLQKGDELTHMAFQLGTFGLTSKVDSQIPGDFMGAFNSGCDDDIKDFNDIIKDGLNLFKQSFGYNSLSFIPTTYTWSPKIEPALRSEGIKYLQGMIHQRIPIDDDNNFTYKKNNFLGTLSNHGLTYLMRNAYFEPSLLPEKNWVGDCLKRIDIAFKWSKPAIISMHRLNVIGAIDRSNRDKNLILLKKLLKNIIDRFSHVEFMSSDELGALIEKSSKK